MRSSMFHPTPSVPRVRVPTSQTRRPSGDTPSRAPFAAPYLSYLLCLTKRLDLLMARRTPDRLTNAPPPMC